MAIDAEKLDAEADADFAKMMGQEQPAPVVPQDKPETPEPPAAEVPPPEPVTEPEPPAPEGNDDWQDKYNKAEESRKNAHALMTQATQKAADLERSNQQMQQQLNAMQQQINQLNQQPAPQAASSHEQPNADQFKELREDYEELDPVFTTLDETAKRNQALEQRLAAIEQERQEEEQRLAREAFWNEVKKTHPDVLDVAASESFKVWFNEQSPGRQQMSQASPEGAAHVMSLYKQSATPSPSPRIEQAKELTEPNVRSRSQPTTQGRQPALTPQQIAALPQKEFDKNEAEYDKMLEQWFKQGSP